MRRADEAGYDYTYTMDVAERAVALGNAFPS
jgi:hypothetical protein